MSKRKYVKVAVKDGTYEGEINEKKRPDGRGIRSWNNGTKFEGEFCNGHPHGYGVFHYSNGQTYEGGWSNGKKNGKGTFKMNTGAKFVGVSKEWFVYETKTSGPMVGSMYDKEGNEFKGKWNCWKAVNSGVKYFVDTTQKLLLNRQTGEMFATKLKWKMFGGPQEWIEKELLTKERNIVVPKKEDLTSLREKNFQLMETNASLRKSIIEKDEKRKILFFECKTKEEAIKKLTESLACYEKDNQRQTLEILTLNTSLEEKDEATKKMKADFETVFRTWNKDEQNHVETIRELRNTIDQNDGGKQMRNTIAGLKEQIEKQEKKIQALEGLVQKSEQGDEKKRIKFAELKKTIETQVNKIQFLESLLVAELKSDGKSDSLLKEIQSPIEKTKILKHSSIDEKQFLKANCIGRGRVGEVFKYRLSINGKETVVAAKYFDHKLVTDASVIGECKKLTCFQHPNLPECFGCYIKGSVRVLFMELCKYSIDELIIRSKEKVAVLSFKRKVHIIKALASGMKYLHDQRIVHRDLKPTNVMVTDKGDVKIIDFDIAKKVDLNSVISFTHFAGTPFFVAPEILSKRKEHDRFCDVFGFGVLSYCILFEVRTNKELQDVLYHGLDVSKRNDQNKITELLQKESWEPLLPKSFDYLKASKQEKEVVKLLKRCCRVDPFDRPSFKRIVETIEKRIESCE